MRLNLLLSRSVVIAVFPLVVSVLVAGQDSVKTVLSFSSGDRHVTALGACEITSQDAGCWNVSGTPDPNLTQRVKLALTSGQELMFKFGRRNVFLVIEESGAGGVNYSLAGNLNVQQVYLNNQNSVRHLTLLKFTDEEGAGSVTINATLNSVPGPLPLSLKLTPGSSASAGDGSLITGRSIVRKNPIVASSTYNYNGYGWHAEKEWVVAVTYSGRVSTSDFQLEDESGKLIKYVDQRGRPVSEQTYAMNVVPPSAPRPAPYSGFNQVDPKAKYLPAYVHQEQLGPFGSFALATDVDLSYVRAIRVSYGVPETHVLGPIPLKPNG